ncbi:DUF814 domain-containing protein [Candidatus Woesearchaeota archaeon]|nr:DUF814 domain-containing protein [Candidatus Woesearchaeota archaeon]
MQMEFDLQKSVDENAGIYFDLAKKSKKKILGAQAIILDTQKKLEKLRTEEAKFFAEEEKKQSKVVRKKEWYEKFHWFFSSENFLCIGGKDATTNEIIIKKHLDKEDIVLHTEAPGSPFFVVKNGQQAGEKTIQETAQAVAVFSKAWKLGLGAAEVFSVKPDQVSKEAKPGEYMSKGSFMIYGKREFYHPKMEYAIGNVEGQVVGGPVQAVAAKTDKYVVLVSGKEKKSDTGKKIKNKLGLTDLDEIMSFVPSGGAEIRK